MNTMIEDRCGESAAFGKKWSHATLLAGMREHYPAIALDDILQVIEHEPPGTIEPY